MDIATWLCRYSTFILSSLIFIYLWISEVLSLSPVIGSLIIGFLSILWIHCSRNNCRKIVIKQNVVVITGCDTGLGFSLAIHCHKHLGVSVIAGVHKKDSEGAKILGELGITTYPVDLCDPTSMKTFVEEVRNYLTATDSNLYSVVNNAGMMVFGEFEWQTYDQMERQIAVNLLGTMKLTKEFLPLMRKHLSRLIVVTSHCASESLPGVATYGATKAGLVAWVTSLRVELAQYGINVVNFIPGSFIMQSNLLSQQPTHFDEQLAEMSEETKSFYCEYFKRYSDYLKCLSQPRSPQRLENPQLYRSFEGALLDVFPCATYKCEPWRYAFYHCLFKITPTFVRDWLVVKFAQMPTWNDRKN